MQPGGGGGRVSPAVARIRATRAARVTAIPAITTLRSRDVSRRSGVLVRRQCPSRGIAEELTARLKARSRQSGEPSGPIFGLLYVVATPRRRKGYGKS